MNNVRMRDVAERAGVSVATVSRSINNGYVSQDALERIHKAIEEMNYHPNQLARNLFHNKTSLIGVIVPNIAHPFFAMLVEELEIALSKQNYKMLLCNTISETSREKEILEMLQENKVDGIIVNNHRMMIEDYARVKMPMVSLDMSIREDVPYVAADHRLGGSMAAHKLIEGGCTKVLQFMGDLGVETFTHRRHFALHDMLLAHGVECINYELKSKEFDSSQYESIINQAFDEYPDVNGIFAVDMIAAQVVRCAHKRGISIPEQLQIVGYDGTWLPAMINPMITTVCQPIGDIARAMVETLFALIDGKKIKGRRLLTNLTWLEGETTRNRS